MAAAAAAVAALAGGGVLLKRRQRGRGGSSGVHVLRGACREGASLATAPLGRDAVSVVSYNILVRRLAGARAAIAAAGAAPPACDQPGRRRAATQRCAASSTPAPAAAERYSQSCTLHPQADCFAWGLTYCPPEQLAWEYRWPLIQEVLAASAADVICLQEVDATK